MNDWVVQLQLKDLVAIITGVTGAVLGIYNFFHSRGQEKVRLRVVPKGVRFGGTMSLSSVNEFATGPNGAHALGLEVINLSKFAVTVDEVGLMPRGQSRFAVPSPIIKDNKDWPRKLEPRESVTVYFDMQDLLQHSEVATVKRAYASTACGSTCFGTTAALKDFVRKARAMVG